MYKNSKQNQRGQVLLIVIMLLATVLTVVVSLTFKTTTDTQTAKLEEEQQKALAAAEAAIEKAVESKQGSGVVTLSGQADYSAFSKVEANITTITNKPTFVSPLIEKDQEYTFYLADYTTGSFGASGAGNVTVSYGSNVGCGAMALEVTIISGAASPYTVTRYVADQGNLLGTGTGSHIDGSSQPVTIEGTTFNCSTSAIAPPANAKLMILRTLFAPTKLGFQGTANLMTQGKIITSQADSKTGVTKKVELFQSFPQLPSDLYVTSF